MSSNNDVTVPAGTVRHPIRRGRHRKSSRLSRIATEHSRRLMSFSLIGFTVFGLGVIFQAFLVRGLSVPTVPAYIAQLMLSIQANFLANYKWTWSDRKAPFWRSFWRYNIKRAAGALLSLGLYPLLVKFGINYLVANALLVVLLTPANYVLGHWWTFVAGGEASRRDQLKEDREHCWSAGLDAPTFEGMASRTVSTP